MPMLSRPAATLYALVYPHAHPLPVPAHAGETFTGMLVPVLGGLLADTKKEFEGFNVHLKAKVEGKK